MDHTIALHILMHFNERVELISQFEMVRKLLHSDHVDYGLIAPEKARHYSGTAFTGGSASAEGTHALANNLRLFYQKNDATCISHLTEVYESGMVDPKLAAEFGAVLDDMNRKLDADAMAEIPSGTKRTHRDILEVYLYGHLSHTDRRDEYDQIAGNPLFNMLSRVEFDRAVRYFLQALVAMMEINGRAINDLRRLQSPVR